MKKKTSIIILSYNTPMYLELCLNSIRKHTAPHTYEIIVVDNHSTDGESIPYLKAQEKEFDDLKCIYNDENLGFPKGCNQGIELAEKDNDILLLNSDTIVTPRYLENMQRALYHDEKIGATSCVTNNCSNWQKIPTPYTSTDELEEFAEKYNHSDPTKWFFFPKLVAFCLLIKREVVDKVGLLDEIFTPGNFEDDDYSYRIRQAGYKLLLLKDTFIHHFGSSSFVREQDAEKRKKQIEDYNKLLARNKKLFLDKWHLDDQHGKSYFDLDSIKSICLPLDSLQGKILFIDEGSERDLFVLQTIYPKAQIEAVFLHAGWAKIAKTDFPVYLCHTQEEILQKIKPPYEIILIPALIGIIDETLVHKLQQKVKKRGHIIYPSANQAEFLHGALEVGEEVEEKMTPAEKEALSIILSNIENDVERYEHLLMLDMLKKELGLSVEDLKLAILEEAAYPPQLFKIIETFFLLQRKAQENMPAGVKDER